MPTGLKSPLTSVRQSISAYLADRPWIAQTFFGRRGKMIILAVATVFIWMFGYGQIYKPGAQQLSKLKKRIDKTADKIEDMRNEFPDFTREQQQLETTDKLVKTVRERLQNEEKRLPRRNELAEVLDQIMTPAEHTSFSIVSIKPAEEKKQKSPQKKGENVEPKFYPEESFEINVLAGFWDLVAYLSRLEQISSYFSFPSLNIEADKKNASPPKVSLEVATLFHEERRAETQEDEVFKQDVEPLQHALESRDPFGSVQKTETVQLTDDTYKVTGIIWRGGRKIAIINNEVVKEGDLLGDAKVVSIGDRKITLDEHGRRYELGLP